jgi:hypothetical protein
MMRAIAIDPVEQTTSVTEVHCEKRLISKRFQSRAHSVARFPNGDILLAGQSNATHAFTVGGSKPIVGPALLVGRPLPFGEHAPARTSLDDVRSMVRWISA